MRDLTLQRSARRASTAIGFGGGCTAIESGYSPGAQPSGSGRITRQRRRAGRRSLPESAGSGELEFGGGNWGSERKSPERAGPSRILSVSRGFARNRRSPLFPLRTVRICSPLAVFGGTVGG
jgi:hypothetical protein